MDRIQIEVRVVFKGGMADEDGALDGSDHATQIESTKRLLSLIAHTFLHGNVPRAAPSKGKGYDVRHVGSFRASHGDVWQVVVEVAQVLALPAAIWGPDLRTAVGQLAKFTLDGLRSAVGTGEAGLPDFSHRREPTFSYLEGNRQPFIEWELEDERERQRLRQVAAPVIFNGIARPLGRCADELIVYVGDKLAIQIDRKQAAFRRVALSLEAEMREMNLLG